MSEYNDANLVRPIKFQKIAEDCMGSVVEREHAHLNHHHHHQQQVDTTTNNYKNGPFSALPEDNNDDVEISFGKRANYQKNFSLEYSYPAVIFENVCFRVDKSQQQANFFNECLFKLKECACLGEQSDQKVNILKSVNLNVPYGSIFGLLGPSSCGKTTLLRCLVGLLRPSSGSIRLFGHTSQAVDSEHDSNEANEHNGRCCGSCLCGSRSNRIHSNKCKVPGTNVGYMPQDLGLYEDFTIRQLLTMFGKYMRMNGKLIETRIDFMAQFLDLPHVDRQIHSLSGGQKRRVSFAIACLHMPPLIILDEPTVGVDPLLRQSIWKYLRHLASAENKTIIITTHYIEEAAQADQVALMRAGEILVQDTPKRIMELNNCKTLEEAFLRICNNIETNSDTSKRRQRCKLSPQPEFNWRDKIKSSEEPVVRKQGQNELIGSTAITDSLAPTGEQGNDLDEEARVMLELKLKAQEKLALFDELKSGRSSVVLDGPCSLKHNVKFMNVDGINKLSMAPNLHSDQILPRRREQVAKAGTVLEFGRWENNIEFNSKNNTTMRDKDTNKTTTILTPMRLFNRNKFSLNDGSSKSNKDYSMNYQSDFFLNDSHKSTSRTIQKRLEHSLGLLWALLYKNYRRNVNSLPLLAFQFMMPMIQMVSFSLCVGGRPTNIGLGLVNHDHFPMVAEFLHSSVPLVGSPPNSSNISSSMMATTNASLFGLTNPPAIDPTNENEPVEAFEDELLSHKYLSFIDDTMLSVRPYDSLHDALNDVRRAKLWAVMEIGDNFTTTITKRFDLENFYQLNSDTIQQSVIKLYPDRSNKVLDMICQRSLVNSYRKFLLDHFEHFKRLPIDIKEPVFDIKPNIISNSIDGYTESIAPGLLASLTYIMAAGLTTFIMVVERSVGILERTFTSGVNPAAYLLAHALFRSLVMMLQIGLVLILTFYVLKQPLVGSLWLAYLILMTLNLTGIAYGLLISSVVTDQNGAALTIVSSLVVKITLSGILWPFEAIPVWLRMICYIQPLTMPVQALKAITLKGATLADRPVILGFVVSISWLVLFLTISARRFKFYQH